MARDLERRELPEAVEAIEVSSGDVSYEEPSLPDPDWDYGYSRGGELLAAGWPLEEGIFRLENLLERHPVLEQISDLPKAIQMLKDAEEIVKNLPTKPEEPPREPPTIEEALAIADELQERLRIAGEQ